MPHILQYLHNTCVYVYILLFIARVCKVDASETSNEYVVLRRIIMFDVDRANAYYTYLFLFACMEKNNDERPTIFLWKKKILIIPSRLPRAVIRVGNKIIIVLYYDVLKNRSPRLRGIDELKSSVPSRFELSDLAVLTSAAGFKSTQCRQKIVNIIRSIRVYNYMTT